MSELQISLLGIGAVVVAGVYLFNVWQERQFRKRAERDFASGHDDVLMQEPEEAPPPTLTAEAPRREPRLEPVLGRGYDDEADDDGYEQDAPDAQAPQAAFPREEAPAPAIPHAHAHAGHIGDDLPDSGIDYVVELTPAIAVDGLELAGELRALAAGYKKPLRAAGRIGEGPWHELNANAACTQLRYGLQLASRAGVADVGDLASFRDVAARWAAKHDAALTASEPPAAHQSALDLDSFCAELDVAIGVNVVSAVGAPFAGTQIRALAEAAGLQLEPDGVFYRRSEDGDLMFTLDNHEPMPFVPEQMRALKTHGITFLIDVPRTRNAARAFDAMVGAARDFASVLEGTLVDDNRAPLSDTAIARIRAQMCEILARMEHAHMPAGSARALRLFS